MQRTHDKSTLKGISMTILILGLILFLAPHSIRIVAEDWRTAQIARLGAMPWRLAYTLVSLLGLGLIIWGYGMARAAPQVLWHPPTGMRHAAALLTLFAFILLAAAYVPRNSILARVHHPMALGVTFWALAHLLANGTLADVLLFGSFLVWSKLAYLAARKRDRKNAVQYEAGTLGSTLATVGVGLIAYLAFAFWLHAWLIGVRPFG